MATPDLATTGGSARHTGKRHPGSRRDHRHDRKAFESIGVESTEETGAYRELLFTTGGIEAWISGVILFDEDDPPIGRGWNAAPGGSSRSAGSSPASRSTQARSRSALAPGETITEGLDDLRERLSSTRARRALCQAAAVLAIGSPANEMRSEDAHALARYAALSQEAGLVPIVEPEVLMDGDHAIEKSFDITSRTLDAVFGELRNQRVSLQGVLLKPNMVLAGYAYKEQPSDERIAEMTLSSCAATCRLPCRASCSCPVVSPREGATSRLNALNARGPQPWALSFSYGRALQASALAAWKGEDAYVRAAQCAFAHRARLNGAARSGSYKPEMETVGQA